MFLLAFLSCSDDPTVPEPTLTGVEGPLYSGEWTLPDRSGLEGAELPVGPDGSGYTLLETHEGILWADIDHRDAVTAASECAAVVVACVEVDQRNLHGCLLNVPICETDTPWVGETMCCPSACTDRYRELRELGQEPIDAFIAALYESPGSCMPGLDEDMAEVAR